MSITEAAKHDVYKWFEEAMGKERATTLMAMVSPTGWADVATKQDLTHEATLLRTEMTAEFAKVRTEMTTEFAKVRTEMTTEFAKVRTEMTTEFTKVRTEMAQFATKGDLDRALRTHTYFTVMTGGVLMGIAVTLARMA